MRVALAAVLFARPDVLLLDEPTNYLDLEGAIWLETFLARYPHTVLVISHDRDLLNRSVGAILHLDRRKLTLYQGPYDTFEDTRRARLEQLVAEKRKQDAARAHMQSFVDRFRAKASKARQAQSRIKALERMKPIAAIVEDQVAAFNFPTPEELSPPIIRLEDVSVGYDGRPVLRDLNLRIDQDDRIALLGQNGQGKSTLAKLLSDRLAPMARAQGRLVEAARRLLRPAPGRRARARRDAAAAPAAAAARRAAGQAARRGWRPAGSARTSSTTEVGRLSGGQKTRLSLLLATLDAPHMIILDEPTNHLDIESRDALVEALTEYGGAVILVSHDPHLVELVAERLWLVKDGRVAAVRGRHGRLPPACCSPSAAARRSRAREEKPKPRPAPPRRGGAAPGRGRAVRGAGGEARGDARARSTGGWPTRCSTRAATAEAIARLQKKRAEVEDGLARAEALWLAALERLEAAASGLMLELLVTAFVTLFVIIDPIGLAPLFVALTHGMTEAERPRVGRRAILALLRAARGLRALRRAAAHGDRHLAAGLPHLGRAAALPDRARHALRAAHRPARAPGRGEDRPDPSVFPLAMPLIAGPGALATMILLTSQHAGDALALVGINLVMVAVLALTYLLFRVSGLFERPLGHTGIVVLTRLFGILLAALSVQFVLDGLRDYGFCRPERCRAIPTP